jgi:hypothetical protein
MDRYRELQNYFQELTEKFDEKQMKQIQESLNQLNL